MKLRKFFALALASTLFVACDNEDNQNIDSGNNPIEGDAWIALSINPESSGAQLRSLHNPDQEVGSPEESKINSITAIFFDGATSAAKVVSILPLGPSEIGTPGSATGTPGAAFKVSASAETVLLVANAPSSFSPTIGSTYAAVNAAIVVTSEDLKTAGGPISNGFMMTNSKGGLEPSLSDGTTTSLKLHATQTAATNAPLAINIDRVVSKVRVFIKTVATDSKVTISEADWMLNVTNKKYFPASERIATFKGTLTPYDQYKLGSYRIDPNYSTQATSEYFNLPTNYAGLWNADKAAQYCLENTQTKANNKQAYTTQVVIRAKYMPTEFLYPDGSKETILAPATKDWMLISGGYYSELTLVKWIEKELTAKYAEADPSLFSTPLTTALNTYLPTVGVTAITLPPTATAGDIATLITSFEQALSDAASKTDKAKTVGNFTYYADAYNHYKVMIKHDNDDATSVLNELGEFGVVRNSVYDVNISTFGRPGYPTVPEPKTDEDDEDDEKWLSVQININPWTWYTQNVDL